MKVNLKMTVNTELENYSSLTATNFLEALKMIKYMDRDPIIKLMEKL